MYTYTTTKKVNDLNYQFDNTIYATVEKEEIKNRISKDFFDRNKESLRKIKRIYDSKK